MTGIPLDPAILTALPPNSIPISVKKSGKTNWSSGVKIETIVDGENKNYFAKLIEREEFVGMAEAEYEGQKAISAVIPKNATKPIAWGFYEKDETKSWFLTHFRDLRPTMGSTLNLQELASIVSTLHQKSVSPTGRFGFHVTPFYGPPPMIVDWTDSWEEFWTREFRSGLDYAQGMRGKDPELEQIAQEFIDKVVPRLLRPLQTGGRNIKPSLCHGDLWDGNIQLDPETEEPILFDPCPFYGHHEMDLQCMRDSRYTVGLDYVELYAKETGRSEPAGDFDDRNALYAIRNDVMTAGMWSHWTHLLEKAKSDMLTLIKKYPNGLADFAGNLTPTAAQT